MYGNYDDFDYYFEYYDVYGERNDYEPGLIEDPEWEECMTEGQWGFEEEEEEVEKNDQR